MCLSSAVSSVTGGRLASNPRGPLIELRSEWFRRTVFTGGCQAGTLEGPAIVDRTSAGIIMTSFLWEAAATSPAGWCQSGAPAGATLWDFAHHRRVESCGYSSRSGASAGKKCEAYEKAALIERTRAAFMIPAEARAS